MCKKLSLVLACLLLFSVTPVMAQIDYCEGNFDNDRDQDGTDAFTFKTDFGRSSLLDPCPVIECQTAEELEMRISYLESLLANVTRNGNDIRFNGVNVQIVNGSGTTDGAVNGLGNLIVGYNELRGVNDSRSGSHNIVVGKAHNYSSYGGLVVGLWNSIYGSFASVSAGHNNIADGFISSVSGGYSNIAIGGYASVSGGYNSTASGSYASVSGGRYNEASGDYSFVGGGGGYSTGEGNKAFGHFSAILGGAYNIAGDPALSNHNIGTQSCISGGAAGKAQQWVSSICGGSYGVASNIASTVCGGNQQIASETYASAFGEVGAAYVKELHITSDEQLKENIVPIAGALDKVSKLQGVTFGWKGTDTGKAPQTRQVGFIAQDVEKVIPEVVASNGHKAVEYGNMVAVLVEAVKELKSQNVQLQERIDALECKD